MFKITMDSKQLKLMINWIGKLDGVIRDPQTMSAGVKFIGRGMQKQFSTEGSHGGRRWQNLTAYTNKVREERGYPAAHPILVQSGGLRSVTADALASFHTSTGAMIRSTSGANMVASSTALNFKASASGPKVQNHFGGKGMAPPGLRASEIASMRNPGKIPSRPFFGFTDDDANLAFNAMMTRIMSQWASKSGTAKRM